MKKEIADKWVAALRSGKYKQGKGVLCEIEDNEEHYCCLGVLCDILETPFTKLSGHARYLKQYVGTTSCLPSVVMTSCGIKDNLGLFNPMRLTLSALNDNGNSFKEIADIIERNWKQL